MSRKQTNTVEYFPHVAKPGKTIYILESKFGNDGYAFWFKLLETLCQAEDHYLDCSDASIWEYLLAKTRVNSDSSSEILALLANMGNIDRSLWEERLIIWCENLVGNLKDVYTRRGREVPSKPLNTDKCAQESSRGAIPESEMPAEQDFRIKSTQSKVEESRVKESKVEDGGVLKFFDYPIDIAWFNVLVADFKDLDVKTELAKCADYWSDSRRKCKSPKLAIRNWMLKAREIRQSNSRRPGTRAKDLPTTKELKEGWEQ